MEITPGPTGADEAAFASSQEDDDDDAYTGHRSVWPRVILAMALFFLLATLLGGTVLTLIKTL